MATLRELDSSDFDDIKTLFRGVFTQPPWNDDWSDEAQLDAYLKDLMGARTPLTLGRIEDGELIGLSLGSIKHWYEGTEYVIDELCIRTDLQGKGYGTAALQEIIRYFREHGANNIRLSTKETNTGALSLYHKAGFRETGEMNDEEIVLLLDLV